MPLSPDEISSKQFVVALRGYDRSEVDAYLRALASDQARLLQRLQELESGEPPGGDTEAGRDPAALLDEAMRSLRSLRRLLRS